MSQKTKQEVMARSRRQYVKAGPKYRSRLLNPEVELLGCHHKAAIRALRTRPTIIRAAALITGRPKEYEPQKLLTSVIPLLP